MSRRSYAVTLTPPGFPRVSGDEPGECQLVLSAVRFSPRERG